VKSGIYGHSVTTKIFSKKILYKHDLKIFPKKFCKINTLPDYAFKTLSVIPIGDNMRIGPLVRDPM